MADRDEFGLVLGKPAVSRSTKGFVRVDLRLSDPAQSYGKDDVSLTLVLHPPQARVLVEELHTLLEEPLHDD